MERDITNYVFKPGLPVEFEILSLADLYRDKRDIITRPHRTAFYHIIWFRKGNPMHLVDFSPVGIVDDTLLFMTKDTVQVYDDKDGIEGLSILFTDAFFYQTAADARFLKDSILFNDLLSVSTIQLNNQDTPFHELLHLMQNEVKQGKDSFQPSILKNYLHSFLLQAERLRRNQDFQEVRKGPDFDYVILFRDLLEAGFNKNKQVSYYATQLNVTEKRLNLATAKVLGKTPKQMIDDRVMLEAKRLLAHTNDSIKGVGFILGFEEPTNFIKYFRKHSRQTPVEFRESFLMA